MENSVTSKDVHEEFMPYDNVNDIVDQLFQSLLLRCQGNLETSMRGVILFLIQFNCCIINVTKQIFDLLDHILIVQTG